MIKITVYQNSSQQITGFVSQDHAGYGESGTDIVCAAVSVLVINCVNSIETLTDAAFVSDSDESAGMISFRLTEEPTEATQLLLQSMVLGLEGIEENYDRYVDLIFEEV